MSAPLPQYRFPLPENHEIRVFISSTFRDMDRERSQLITLFKSLRSRAALKGVSISLIDLRWGITEEESRAGKVIDICLQAIRESRPFFIGLIGNRYGWCPGQDAGCSLTDSEEYSWLADDLKSGLSVTEIEIQFGVLRSRDEMSAAFFLRTPFEGEDGGEASAKLLRLREALTAQKKYPAELYETVPDLIQKVEKHFLRLLDRYPDIGSSAEDSRELSEQAWRENLLKVYNRPEDAYGALADFMESDSARRMAVTGPRHIGKSSLLACYSDMLNWDGPTAVTCVYHPVMVQGEKSVNVAAALGRKLREVFRKKNMPQTASAFTPVAEENTTLFDNLLQSGEIAAVAELMGDNVRQTVTEMREDLNSLKSLAELSDALEKSRQRIILIIDHLDRVDDSGKDVSGFIAALPENVKVIYSCQQPENDAPGDSRLLACADTVYEIRPLDRESNISFSRRYLSGFSKKLSGHQEELVASWPLASYPEMLVRLLSEIQEFGNYEKLSDFIKELTAARTPREFCRKVFRRLKESYGVDNIRRPLLLLAVSEKGLSEEEIKTDGMASQYLWLRLRGELASWMTEELGLYRISDPEMSDVVIEELGGEEAEAFARRTIIYKIAEDLSPAELSLADFNMRSGHFAYNDRYLHLEDRISQLIKLRDWESLEDLPYRAVIFEVLFRNNPQLLKCLVSSLADNLPGFDIKEYFKMDLTEVQPQLRPVIANDIGRFVGQHFGLYDLALDAGLEAESQSGVPSMVQSVLTMNQGCRLAKAKRYAEAVEVFRKALDMQVRIKPLPETQIATTRHNMAYALYYADKEEEALKEYRMVIDHYSSHAEPESQQRLTSAYAYGGHCLLILNRYEEAVSWLQEAIARGETLYGEKKHSVLLSRYRMALSLYRGGRHDKSFAMLDKLLPLAMEAGDEKNIIDCHKLYTDLLVARARRLKTEERLKEADIDKDEALLHKRFYDETIRTLFQEKVRYEVYRHEIMQRLYDDYKDYRRVLRIAETLDIGDYERSPGSTATTFYHAGLSAFKLEEYPLAVKYFRKEYEFRSRNIPYDEDTTRSGKNLGVSLYYSGDTHAAIEIFKEVLALETANHGKATPAAADLRSYLATLSSRS